MIIGVAGQLASGKDVTADYLKERLELKYSIIYKRRAFARAVKDVFCNTFGVDIDFVEKWKRNSENPPKFKKNVRQSLQFIGDGFREMMPTIWLDIVFRDKDDNVLLSDVRYINEIARIKEEEGLNILLWRPKFENNDPNGSESQIRPVVDYFVKSGISGPTLEHFLRVFRTEPNSVPPGCLDIDYFLINDGDGKESLQKKIDEEVMPWLNTIHEIRH